MNNTLSELFQKSLGEAILISGSPIHPIYKKLISAGSTVIINRVSESINKEEGLRIKIENGLMEINGQSVSDIVLWGKTSPKKVSLKIVATGAVVVKFWNVWSQFGLTQAWVGNAGMKIEESNNCTKIYCSDGIGEIDFSDLIIEISINP